MPGLTSTSTVSVAAYDDVCTIPKPVIEVLNNHAREANVILAQVEKALARPEPSKHKEYWIVCSTKSLPTETIDFVLSCAEGAMGSYPIFIFSTRPSSQLDRDFLHERVTFLTQALFTAVGIRRVFSVFAPDKVTAMFQNLWTELTGVRAVSTPYYAATFTFCDKNSHIDRSTTIHPSLQYNIRPAVDNDIPGIADQCYGFASGSKPFVLSLERATTEATLLVRNKQVWVHEIQRGDETPEIASIVCFTRQSASVAAITKVYTNPRWRKLGCAERLVSRVCKFLLKTKLSVVLYVAHDNLAAAKVYQRVGFAGLDKSAGDVNGVESWLEVGFDRDVVELGHW